MKCNSRRKTAVLRFRAPKAGLRATHDVHRRLSGKLVVVVDFLLVLTEIFSLGVRRRERISILKSAFSLQEGQFGPKFQLEGVALHQAIFLPEI